MPWAPAGVQLRIPACLRRVVKEAWHITLVTHPLIASFTLRCKRFRIRRCTPRLQQLASQFQNRFANLNFSSRQFFNRIRQRIDKRQQLRLIVTQPGEQFLLDGSGGSRCYS